MISPRTRDLHPSLESVSSTDELHYRDLIDALPTAIYTTDAQGRLTHFNPACIELSGRVPQLGTDHWCVTWKLFHADGTPMPHDECPMAIALKEGRTVRGVEAIAERPDGKRIWFMPYPTPIKDADGRIVGGVNMLVDITERKRSERALRESQGQLESELTDTRLLQQISAEITHEQDVETLYEKIMDAAVVIMRSDFASMQMLHPERGSGGELRLLAFRGFNVQAAKAWEWVRPDSESTCGRALRTRTRAIAVDVRECAHMAGTEDLATYLQTGILAVQTTPLFARDGTIVGMISTHWSQPHEPSERDLRLLDILARQAADLIERVRGEDALRQSEERYRSLTEAITSVVWTCDAEGRFVTPQPSWSQYTGQTWEEYRDFGWSHALHPDDQERVRSLWESARAGARLYQSDGRLWHAASSSYRHFEARGVPIRNPDGSVREWVGKCLDVENRHRAETGLQRQNERLRLLSEAAAALLAADDPDAMLRALLAKIGPHLGVDTYFNYMVNERGDALRLASYDGISDEVARSIARLEFGQAICGTAALHCRSVVSTHIQSSDDPKAQLVKSLGIRAYACHPLMDDDVLLGTLSFASRTKERFDPDESIFLETICRYVAVAYGRLRLLGKLKEADRRKDEFLAILSHELRNPLAPVRHAVQVLRLKGPDEPELRWARDVIERQVEHLSRLIDDLLDISRITRNRLELRRQRVELAEVIQGAVESSRPNIEERRHELTVTLPPEPIYLNGDLVRLAQVFLNLLNNAAKYMERGGRIWLTAERQGDEVVVQVQDTGVGIPEEKLPHLFEMFFQVDHSLERSNGGLGVGLSLAGRLVELHGGRIQARSGGVGKGSEFIVRLPVLVEEPKAHSGPEPAAKTKMATLARRILVVDDNRDSSDSLAILLQMTGNEVYTAYDGPDGIEAAEKLRPDMILLDIGMPKMNGYDVARRIREYPWGQAIFLVALTGWGHDDDRQRSHEAGFDAHLVKPLAPGALDRLLAAVGSARDRGAGKGQFGAS